MFTGIIANKCKVVGINKNKLTHKLVLEFSRPLLKNLKTGASVSVDGVCLTVTKIIGAKVEFDIVPGTLTQTTLSSTQVGQNLNIERSLTKTSEIGGHQVSGHVDTQGKVSAYKKFEQSCYMEVKVAPKYSRYLFTKGFITINGASLTITQAKRAKNTFSVWLIPETLQRTNLSELKSGKMVNIEFDKTTQVIVDTIYDALSKK